MKFRFYQLLYIATIALLVVALVKPVVNIVEPDGATSIMSNFGYATVDGAVSRAVVALGVVLIAAVAVNAFACVAVQQFCVAKEKYNTVNVAYCRILYSLACVSVDTYRRCGGCNAMANVYASVGSCCRCNDFCSCTSSGGKDNSKGSGLQIERLIDKYIIKRCIARQCTFLMI